MSIDILGGLDGIIGEQDANLMEYVSYYAKDDAH